MTAGVTRPRMRDVAARAGVSTSLVSLAFREPERVSAKRREAIMAAAEELGYRPNRVARSLKLQRTHLIGAVVSDLHNPFFVDVFDGLQAAAHAAGYRAVIGSAGRDLEREREVCDSLLELRIDGAVLMGSLASLGEVRTIARTLPTVAISRPEARRVGVDTVGTDENAGARLVVEHLVTLGHRRIAHLTGGRGAGAALRRAGYEQAMMHFGLAHYVQSFEGSYDEAGGYRAALAALADADPPTALFAANDVAAVGALEAVEERGARVPEDISLVGYDNTSLSGLGRMRLTTVDQPREAIGRLAMQALLERFDGRRRSRAYVVVPHLVVRNSTAAPRPHLAAAEG